ncbi:CPBP family intramembrane glutamic endopeptidase [Natrinema salinisoli]|uniref:CPBP family intramembrane glutamic endopeptidase n=1 Tax=Natrinema salinisoli TaxID=2878535 RepID=UPI001CEFEC37|nr:CPBP family intramembrane glutamic endopeptidase [Natrinema salinisoli]
MVGWILGEPVAFADLSEIGFRFVFTLFLAGALEEFGWRGFLQPRLQEQRSALFAAVVIGIIWALWHAPLTIGGTGAGYESGEITALLIGLPLFSIVIAWVYNSTRGGVLFAMHFHTMINTTPILEVANVTAVMELAELAILLGLPIGIILYYGRTYLAATRPEPPIPGKTHNH